ncbi:unnamed protein product [Effrenium voratum]|uniref:Uncharacterized protein n=1 Tax=Effrenium voratum TaxID=2562239 RepID=A0AA36IBL2_9DINO|nr:unnamed protein product [Effrenium voratum]
MALLFVKTGENIKPVVLKSGSVVSANHLDVCEASSSEEMKSVLMGLKKDELHDTLSMLGLRVNRKSMTKSDIVEMIVSTHHQQVVARANARNVIDAPASSSEAPATPSLAKSLSLRVNVIDKRDTPNSLDGDSFEIDIENHVSIETLGLSILEGLRTGDYNFKRLLCHKGKYLTVSMQSLASIGMQDNDIVVIELLNPDDQFFVKVMTGEIASKSNKGDSLEDETSKSEAESVSISDFIQLDEDGEYQFDKAYLCDPGDFDEVDEYGLKICLSEYRGRKLFDIQADVNGKVSALKSNICKHIAEKQPNNKKVLTEDDFYLLTGDVAMDVYKSIKDYMEEDSVEMHVTLHLRLRGGGKMAVKKHMVKLSGSSTTTVAVTDMDDFKKAYDTCLEITKATCINFEQVLKMASEKSLLDMKEFLKTKSTTTMKVHGLCEHMDYYKVIHSLQEKLISSTEALRTLTKKDLDERYGHDIDKIKEAVSNAHAVKLALAQLQNVQMSD